VIPDSLFVSDETHKREVTLGDGTKHVLEFHEIPAVKFAAYNEARSSQDPEVRHASIAKLVSISLGIPEERAAQLKPAPLNEIMNHILEVNGFWSVEKKD
jgi:hypothetical protein